jgi:hypothetical protein
VEQQVVKKALVQSVAFAATGQAFLLASTIYVTRILPASALDEYGILFQLFSIGLICGSFRLEQAILYSRSLLERDSLVFASLALIGPAAILLCLGSYAYLLSSAVSSSALQLSIVFLGALAGGCAAKVLIQLGAATKMFELVARGGLVRPSALAIAQVAAISIVEPRAALPLALVTSQIFYAVAMALPLSSTLAKAWSKVSMRSAKAAVWRHRRFPYFSLPQNIMFVLSESLVPLSLPFKFPGAGSVASYWLAARVVFAPATVFAESVRPIIYRNIQENRGRVFSRSIQLSLLFGAIFILPTMALGLFGEELFALVFGVQMASAGKIAFVLSMLVAFNMATLPIVGAIPILGLQREHMAFELLGLTLRLGMVTTFKWSSPLELIFAASIGYIVVLLAFYIYAYIKAVGVQRVSMELSNV